MPKKERCARHYTAVDFSSDIAAALEALALSASRASILVHWPYNFRQTLRCEGIWIRAEYGYSGSRPQAASTDECSDELFPDESSNNLSMFKSDTSLSPDFPIPFKNVTSTLLPKSGAD